MPLGPSQQYLCKYNNYVLPGYVQNESFDSMMNIASHYGAYIDGSPSEETGLQNKALSVTLKVWETDYLSCKDQINLASTYLRSKRGSFASLYLQHTDKHYDAFVKSIQMSKDAGTSPKIAEYQVEFECRPWLIGETLHSLSGTTTVTTDDVSRTIANGGWTPTIVTVTGTNVVISGITEDGQSTGGFTIDGAVTDLVVDTEAFTAKMGSTNKNDAMITKDYRLYVGPGKTTFTIANASSCVIEYYDRWYI